MFEKRLARLLTDLESKRTVCRKKNDVYGLTIYDNIIDDIRRQKEYLSSMVAVNNEIVEPRLHGAQMSFGFDFVRSYLASIRKIMEKYLHEEEES